MLAAPPVFKWPKSASGAKTIVSSKPIGRLFTAKATRPPETHGSRSSFQWRFLRKTSRICCVCCFDSGSVAHSGPFCPLCRLRASMRAVPPRKLRRPRTAEMITCGAPEEGAPEEGTRALRARDGLRGQAALYLPYISPISPLHLPYISCSCWAKAQSGGKLP